MKTRYLLVIPVLTLLATVASAGLNLPVTVSVNLVDRSARGSMHAARTADDDVSYIGCGIRVTDDGVNLPFSFGFCQAGDSEENEVTCFTQSAGMLETLSANSDFAFILFNWRDDGFGGAECTRIGFSTQSFYLPDFETVDSDDDDCRQGHKKCGHDDDD